MKKLVAPIILVAAAGAGGAGGYFLRASQMDASSVPSPEVTTENDGRNANDHENESSRPKTHGGTEEGGHGEGRPETSFMKFSRQFVTPVIVGGRPESLIILDVSLEVDASLSDSIYSQEPRLRDAVLRVFLKQASSGTLASMFVDPDVLEETRGMILDETRTIAGEGVLSVLIMDVGYQPY